MAFSFAKMWGCSMNLIFITGPGAVGKMAVGKELSERLGYGFMHNHIAIEPVLEVCGKFDSSVVLDIRKSLFYGYLKNNLDSKGFVVTLMVPYDVPFSFVYLDNLVELAEGILGDKKVKAYYVELFASLETRLQRNRTPLRLELKKSKRDLEESDSILLREEKDRLTSYVGEVEKYFPNYLRIENDSLSVDEQVAMIINKFGFSK